jgi:hypothetical protein
VKFFRLRLRPARRLGGLLAAIGALVTTLVVTGTAAMAQVLPPSGDVGEVSQPAPPAPVAGGMPGWQITLIAVGAALVAAVLAVLADRIISTRGRLARGTTQAWEA